MVLVRARLMHFQQGPLGFPSVAILTGKACSFPQIALGRLVLAATGLGVIFCPVA